MREAFQNVFGQATVIGLPARSVQVLYQEKVGPLREAFQNAFGQATVIGLPARSVQIIYKGRRWGHCARPSRTSSDRPPSSACQPGQFRYYIRRRWGHCARPFRTPSDRPPSLACQPGQFRYYIRGEGGATSRGHSERLRTDHRHRPAGQVSSSIILGEKVGPLREAFQNVFGQATVIGLPARSFQNLFFC